MKLVSSSRAVADLRRALLLASGLFASACTLSDDPVPVAISDEGPDGLVFPNFGDDPAPVNEGGMPADFTAAERGGWKLGPALAAEAATGAESGESGRTSGCGSILTGVLHDVRESHPDFGGDITNLRRGLVQDNLGMDGKPVLAGNSRNGFIQSAERFRQWYENVANITSPFSLALYLAPNAEKFSFESHDFFPLDGAGFGNDGQDHNFSFTFELHTRFRYKGGEV